MTRSGGQQFPAWPEAVAALPGLSRRFPMTTPLEATPREQQIAMALMAHAARADHDAITASLHMLGEPSNTLDLNAVIGVIFDECGCVMPIRTGPFDPLDLLDILEMMLEECQWAMRHCGEDVAQRFSDIALAFYATAAAA
jgi:hypothetical protein